MRWRRLARSGVAALALMTAVAALGRDGPAGAQTEDTQQVSSTGPFTVAEGTVKVAQMTATGFTEGAAELFWSITTGGSSGADGDEFELRIDNVLEFVEPPDFENPTDADTDNTYEVTVKVSNGADTDPVEATATISVTVSDVGFTAFDASTLAVDLDEHSHRRVATLDAGDPVVEWTLSGSDSGWFRIADGALRFRSQASGGPPDYESRTDSNSDNVYEVTVTAEEDSSDSDTTDTSSVAVSVTILNVDEPGAVELSDTVPKIGEELTATLSDPDGSTANIVWKWERSAGRSAWETIDGASAATYTPTAADAEDYLRVTAAYDDAEGTGKTASEIASSPSLGELLESLTVTTTSSRQMYPEFDPEVLHYAVGCPSEVTLSLSAENSGARVSISVRDEPGGLVAGVQQASTDAEVTVTGLYDGIDPSIYGPGDGYPDASDIEIVVSDAEGASTTYVVHCIQDNFPEITPIVRETDGLIEDLILMQMNRWFPSMVDPNGVPRFHRRVPVGGPFFRVFQVDGRYRYAFSRPNFGQNGTENAWVVLDEYHEVVDDTVTTSSPLRRTNGHDFRILDDGNYLIMSYEPERRDLRFMGQLIEGLLDRGQITPQQDDALDDLSQVKADSTAVQIVTPRMPFGAVEFEWNSFDDFDLRDCTNHRFPHDYAHGNSLQRWHAEERDQDWIVISLRGCSAVAIVDAETEQIVAKLGRTNLSDEEWAAVGKVPPLVMLDDPEGEFCGNHAAWMQPHEHLVIFDNGNACVTDPRTGEAFRDSYTPRSDRFSRAVEYALDIDNGEAVFVRDHSLHDEENREGRSSGHVDVLDNGDWLIGWGRANHDTDPDTAWGPDEAVTQVDPDTGEEKFAFQISVLSSSLLDVDDDGDTEREQLRVRPIPVHPVALARDRVELEAEFATGSEHTDGFFTSAQARPTVVVSFNQPVVDFDETTASITVSGGSLESVAPHVVAGDPAHSYLLTLAPDGEADITVALVTGEACDADGVCTADGSTLSEAPAGHRVRYSSPPVIDTAKLAWDVAENTTAVGQLSATDDDTAISRLVWSLPLVATGADDDDFTLGSTGVLRLRAGKDYEMPDDAGGDGTYEVMVQVSDGDSTVEALAMVTLTDVDEPPSVSGESVVRYDENDTAVVDIYRAVDPEGGSVQLSLSGPDANDFELVGGVLRFTMPPNYEQPAGSSGGGNTYVVTVEASDGDLTGSLEVRVSVNDVDEAPMVSGESEVSYDENGTAVVDAYRAVDPERDPVAWSLSGPDAGDFELVGGVLRFASTPDFEQFAGSSGDGNTYVVTVEASDGDLTGSVRVEVTVVNVDEAGVVLLSSRQPQDGSVLRASLTDPDGVVGTVAWTWERSSNRSSWSEISGAASAVYTPEAGDVGQWLRATASYGDGHAGSKSARAVSANAVRADPGPNLAPEFPDTETGQRSVDENTPPGRRIGDPVAATDPNPQDQLTYALSGPDAAGFDLDAASGQLSTKAALDHEHTPSLIVLVTATDPGGLSALQSVTIEVVDVNEAPQPQGPQVVRYPENGTDPVADFDAEDPENDPVTWSLSGRDRSGFMIDAAGGLTFTAPPDHETKDLYELTVQATDDDSNVGSLAVTVNVTDIDEAPEVSGDAMPEFRHLGTGTVAGYTARDPERGSIQWSLSGVDRHDLNIDSSGVLRFQQPPDIDRPDDDDGDNTYEITVEAYDGNSTGTLDVSVDVTLTGPTPRGGGGGFGGGGGGGGGPPVVEEPPDGGSEQELAELAADQFEDVDAGDYFGPAVGWMLAHGITVGCGDGSFCVDQPVTRQHFVVFLWRAAGEPEPSQPGSQIFGDVIEDGYGDKAIGWAAEHGVTLGCAVDSGDIRRFCPDEPSTRAQISSFLYRYTGAQHTPDRVFADVDPAGPHTAAIAWMQAHGITNGCRDDSFCPGEPATRAHAATFIYRTATRPDSWGTDGGILKQPG